MLIILFAGCATYKLTNPNQFASKKVSLTFASIKNEGENLITKEDRTIKYDVNIGIEPYILNELLRGPGSAQNMPTVPKGLTISNIESKNGTILVTLKLNSGEKTKEKFDFMLIKTSIALTLLDLEGTTSVGVYMDKVELDENNTPVDLFVKKDIVTETQRLDNLKDSVVYTPDSKALNLVAGIVPLSVSKETTEINGIITEIFKTVDSSNPTKMLFNQNARLINSFIDGGVCTLNFSENILASGLNIEVVRICLYSIVNSVCEVDGVTSVQFWVNGKPFEQYMEYTTFATFLPNSDLVFYR